MRQYYWWPAIIHSSFIALNQIPKQVEMKSTTFFTKSHFIIPSMLRNFSTGTRALVTAFICVGEKYMSDSFIQEEFECWSSEPSPHRQIDCLFSEARVQLSVKVTTNFLYYLHLHHLEWSKISVIFGVMSGRKKNSNLHGMESVEGSGGKWDSGLMQRWCLKDDQYWNLVPANTSPHHFLPKKDP